MTLTLNTYRPSRDMSRLLLELKREDSILFTAVGREFFASLDWRQPESVLAFYERFEDEIIALKRRLGIGYSHSLGLALWIARNECGEQA